jgi:RNA polymerase sigma-70 factor (ECF subfamily)
MQLRLYRPRALATASTNDLPTPLRELFEGHAPFVWRSLGYLGVPDADLDASLRDVFAIVFERLDEYEKQARVRAWLYSICARVGRVYGRRATPRRLELAPDSEALGFGDRVLTRLPGPQREAFLLYEVEDMPLAEVAQALDCSPRTAYARLQAARTCIVAEVERIAASRE